MPKSALTLDEIYKRCIKRHGDKFIYSGYTLFKKPLRIKCKDCGYEYNRTLKSHLRSNGCPKCGKKKGKNIPREEFIKACVDKFGDKFDFDNMNYTKSYEKISGIFCKDCGQEVKHTGTILLQEGCKGCAVEKRRLAYEEKVKKLSKEVHGDKFEFLGGRSAEKGKRHYMTLKCKDCGYEFEQRSDHHLDGQGCPQCAALLLNVGKREAKLFQPWVLKVFKNEGVIFQKQMGRYFVDAYIPSRNLVIEFDEKHHHKKKNAEKDKQRQEEIEKLGTRFYRIDDEDFEELLSFHEHRLLNFGVI